MEEVRVSTKIQYTSVYISIGCTAVLPTIRVDLARLLAQEECTMFAKFFKNLFPVCSFRGIETVHIRKKVMKFFLVPCDSLSLTMAE
jgi:hypothetical protein